MDQLAQGAQPTLAQLLNQFNEQENLPANNLNPVPRPPYLSDPAFEPDRPLPLVPVGDSVVYQRLLARQSNNSVGDRPGALLNEYPFIASSVSYLSDVSFCIDTLINQILEAQTNCGVLKAVHQRLEGVLELLKTRLAVIQAAALHGSTTANYVQQKICGANAGITGLATSHGQDALESVLNKEFKNKVKLSNQRQQFQAFTSDRGTRYNNGFNMARSGRGRGGGRYSSTGRSFGPNSQSRPQQYNRDQPGTSRD